MSDSPTTRVPDDLVNEVRQAQPELAREPLPVIVRAALAFMAGLAVGEAIERAKLTKPGPKPRPQPLTDD